jgi:hypothetical protein
MADAKIDMNAPGFGPGSQKVEPKVEAPEVAEVKPEVKEEVPETTEVESKVPYSRFKKFHDEALELRQRVADIEARQEKNESSETKTESELPSFWVELYGDSDASKKAWKIQSEQNEALMARAQEQAIEAVRGERLAETERIETNVSYLDDQIDTLSAKVGRDLTEKEQSDLLDIVDEYAPKDKEGNYAGDIIPMDKAWEIYELRNQVSKAPKQASRDSIASLSGNPSQGTPDQKEADKNFNPLNWNAWKSRL